ncbi:hypothetical protein V5738_09105 [Salinisphaera sp. SPP-AMP-43]|uniref:hypothetical protein n=1 Tax=Salinisphaera sp. SPP-AMP-43 TaxID=3121288 RepID=UPI003C6E5FA7
MTDDEAARALRSVVEATPSLTDMGLCVEVHWEPHVSIKHQRQILQASRSSLLYNVQGFVRSWRWLRSIPAAKDINPRNTSYTLAQLAERSQGYLTNGAFIAAAMYLGFDYQMVPNTPDVLLNISDEAIYENTLVVRPAHAPFSHSAIA